MSASWGAARRRGPRLLAAVACAALVVVAAPRALVAHAATAPGFAVSDAIDPASGNTYVAARGPGNSLYFYWNLKGRWYGPVAVGAPGTTYSAPSIAVDGRHNVVIAAEGPGNTLYVYWNVSGTWHGPLGVGGPGTAVSTPSIALDQENHLDVAVEGPGQTLSFWWDINSVWHGPAGLGNPGWTVSAPSVSAGTGPAHQLYVAAQGPDDALIVYENSDGRWASPAVSSPATAFTAPDNSDGYFYVQGPGQDIDNWAWTPGPPPVVYAQWPIGAGGLTWSAVDGIADQDATALGPANSLYFYWHPLGWAGPVGVGAPGSSFSVPAMASRTATGANPAIAVEGPANSLYFYWDIAGAWHGPVGIGAPGSTFSSPS